MREIAWVAAAALQAATAADTAPRVEISFPNLMGRGACPRSELAEREGTDKLVAELRPRR